MKTIEEGILAFRSLVKKINPGSHEFNHCSGYLLQSTRDRPSFISYGNNGMLALSHRKQGEVVVTSFIGDRPDQLLLDFAVSTSDSVIVKNVDYDLAEKLTTKGFRRYTNREHWDKRSRFDDNSFPETIVLVNDLVGLAGPRFQSLREEHNRFKRAYKTSTAECRVDTTKEFERLLDAWSDNLSSRNGWPKSEILSATKILHTNKLDFIHYTVTDTTSGRLIGWMSFSEVSSRCLGMNALVNDFSYHNLYRSMMIEAAHIAKELGYTHLNLQGSETEKQFRSKMRLRPVELRKKEHLVFDNK